jgi:HAD superfamily hydrolase (TIGR01509 family)
MKPKLIIFDLFGTLAFPVEKLKREDFFSFYKKIGIEFKTEQDIKSFTSLFAQMQNQATGWHDLSEKILKGFLGKADLKKTKALADFYKENLVYKLYDDVKEIIDLPIQKAILTAGAKFLTKNLELEKFAKVFTPKETIFLKPDERAFLTVLEKMEVKPEEALMVGDEIERDLIPAKNLGMEVILIDRENKIENSSIKKISSLKELKNLLGL